jgi:hypothetical protein
MSEEETKLLATAANQSLHGSGYVELKDLKVGWDDDRLVLSGTVSSYFLKQLAQERLRSFLRKSDSTVRFDNKVSVVRIKG